METKGSRFAGRYQVALRTHLTQDTETETSLTLADKLGRQALRLGLGSLEPAQIHKAALAVLVSTGHPPLDGEVTRAGGFYRRALAPLATAARAARRAKAKEKHAHEALRSRAAASMSQAEARTL